MVDLSQILSEWPWQPGRLDVRRLTGADGRPFLQVRVELGVLQMEADGRPDGLPYQGRESVLAWCRDPDRGPLGPSTIIDLAAEMAQRRQRALACAMLEDWVRVRRDAMDNLESIELIVQRAADSADRGRFDGWRAHELAMRARSEAAIAVGAGRRDLAQAALDAGLQSVRDAWTRAGRPELAERGPEVALLRALLDALTLKLPTSQRDELERRLHQALRAENYELAAILRDELRQMGGRP
jgi:hypothetical protein